MNRFKILILAVAVNLASANNASKEANLDANAARAQKEVKILEAICESNLPGSLRVCMQLADKRMDENGFIYDAAKGLKLLREICDSKDEREARLACMMLACESGESRECLNAARYYQTLLLGGEAVSALFQKSCDERGGTNCLYSKFFDKARDGTADEYARKMKKYLKKSCDAGEKEACADLEKLQKLRER